MRYLLSIFALSWAGAVGAFATAPIPEVVALEQQVATLTQSAQVTIVHLWAPWCPNCTSELKNNGWAGFLAANPDVKVVFVTIWRGEKGDGRELLAGNGVGSQPNFQLLTHPNGERKKAGRMTEFLGQPVTWIPSTWIYREGKLLYALNYGELRFPLLQQLVRDSTAKW